MIEVTAPMPKRGPRSPLLALPRLGFAGVGWIGRNRLEAIAASGLARIDSVVDADLGVAERVVANLPGAVLGSSFESLLDRDIDGIVIATPSALHAEQTIACLRSGKAVFCQKPLGRTCLETDAAIEAACSHNRLLGVDLSYRHLNAAQAVRKLIQSGELGEIYAVEAVFHNAYGPDKPWFYDPRASGGGCLLDLGIHLIDLALWCLEFPHVISAQGLMRNQRRAHPDPRAEVEDYATGQMELSSGALFLLATSWRAPAGCDAVIEWQFFGSQGGASIRNINGSFYDFTAERRWPDRSRQTIASPPDDWGGRAAVQWVAQLAKSASFDPTIRQLHHVAHALDQLYGRTA